MNKYTKEFIQYCKQNLDLEARNDMYTYQSISICILDCVFSLRAWYDPTTLTTVKRYADKYMNGDVEAPDNNVNDLISNIEEAGGPNMFANNILDNRQKSGGVLKTEVCLNLARGLSNIRINTIDDFRKYDNNSFLEKTIMDVKGIGKCGVDYLFMLTGDSDRCKKDSRLRQFVYDACGVNMKNNQIQELFEDAVRLLSKEYPTMTISVLDGIIWRKESGIRCRHK